MTTTVDADRLHGSAVVADTHNDLLMAVVARRPARWAGYFRDNWLPQLRDGGVDVQVLPVYVDDTYRPEGALRQTLRMIEAAHRLAEGNADAVTLCLDGESVDATLASGRIALVLALEGCPAIDADIELLTTMHRLGVRIASLTPRALRDHHRNLADAQLKDIAAGGGVICVNFFAGFLDESEHTVDRLVDHVEHVAAVAGIDHVGIGPDFLKEIEDEVWPTWRDDYVIEGIDVRHCIPGLEGPRGLPLVTSALLRRGFVADDVVKVLGGNVVRLLRAELGRRADR